jgi:hypothetical protein
VNHKRPKTGRFFEVSSFPFLERIIADAGYQGQKMDASKNPEVWLG